MQIDLKHTVTSYHLANGDIHVESTDLMGNHIKKVIVTEDDHIKQQLKNLGWTPPNERKGMPIQRYSASQHGPVLAKKETGDYVLHDDHVKQMNSRITNTEKMNFLLVLLACEQCQLHGNSSDFLAGYPSWTERVWALENIVWRYSIKSGAYKNAN